MSRTLTALFDSKDDALAGRERLMEAKVHADDINIHGKSDLTTDGYSDHNDVGFWGGVKNAFLPDEDRHMYEEGLRRGGYMLTADVEEGYIDEAIRALEVTPGVDIEERAAGWRKEGWETPEYKDGNTLEVVEEQLVVGKRETERGGVRVRSYVTERPVHEQIALRKERVNVERRPVNRAIDGVADGSFKDQVIEVTSSSEEAIVGKQARVVEEVVVSKDVDIVTEDVEGTVRRKDVEVEQLGNKVPPRT